MAVKTNSKSAKVTSKTKTAGSALAKPATKKSVSKKSKPVAAATTELPGKRPEFSDVTGAFALFGRAIKILWRHYRIFVWLLIIYALLVILLVHPNLTAASGLRHLKATSSASSFFGGIGEGFVLFIYLLGNGGTAGTSASGTTNNSSVPYDGILVIIMSLVIIWTLRQLYAGAAVRARDAFYKGLTPLVSFILVLLVVSLEMLPGVFGGFLYGTVMTNGIAASSAEKVLWTILLVLLIALTFYLIASSVFALYVVTLPDMTPMKALRSARQLVRNRRLAVLVKLVFLPLVLIISVAIVMIPVLLFATTVAPAVLFLLLLIALFALHSYMYGLYRELLP